MPPVAGKPLNWRNASRIMLAHRCFVVEDRCSLANWDATEGRDGVAIGLRNAEQYVGFVHRMQVQVSADNAIAVDDCATHVGSDFWGIRGLDCSGCRRRGWQAIKCADEQVDKVRGADAGQERG